MAYDIDIMQQKCKPHIKYKKLKILSQSFTQTSLEATKFGQVKYNTRSSTENSFNCSCRTVDWGGVLLKIEKTDKVVDSLPDVSYIMPR